MIVRQAVKSVLYPLAGGTHSHQSSLSKLWTELCQWRTIHHTSENIWRVHTASDWDCKDDETGTNFGCRSEHSLSYYFLHCCLSSLALLNQMTQLRILTLADASMALPYRCACAIYHLPLHIVFRHRAVCASSIEGSTLGLVRVRHSSLAPAYVC